MRSGRCRVRVSRVFRAVICRMTWPRWVSRLSQTRTPAPGVVCCDPGDGALDRPAARNDGGSALVGGLAHNVQGGAQNCLGPGEQASNEGAVGEDEPHPGAQVGLGVDLPRGLRASCHPTTV
jgi:hypothetical protein